MLSVICFWLGSVGHFAFACVGDGSAEQEARSAYERGVARYKAGDYGGAIESFQTAYRLTQAPELLFNIAQAYRHQGQHCALALSYYRRYEDAEPDPTKRARAVPYIAEMDACTAATHPPDPGARRDESAGPAAITSAPAAGPQAISAVPTSPDAETNRPSGGRLPLVLVASGVGLAAIGGTLVGSVFWDDDCSPRCSPIQVDGFRTRAEVGYALVAAGGVAAATGIALWLYRARSAPAQRAWIAPFGAGIVVGKAF
jgi:tetratricopeptide (TPR) repeat protein